MDGRCHHPAPVLVLCFISPSTASVPRPVCQLDCPPCPVPFPFAERTASWVVRNQATWLSKLEGPPPPFFLRWWTTSVGAASSRRKSCQLVRNLHLRIEGLQSLVAPILYVCTFKCHTCSVLCHVFRLSLASSEKHAWMHASLGVKAPHASRIEGRTTLTLRLLPRS
ncbi:hypothetical protein LXA43DRAFT_536751 [Ganoderma leucocontextum]|nr:hypothetical protein LXA43DRAFT_536751 [Ganoderma leucocontextum]